MEKIIGLTGYARSGKNSSADAITNYFRQYGYTCEHYSFAYPIYKAVAILTNRSVEFVEKHKDEICEAQGVTYRKLLQTLGTDWARNINKDFWIRNLKDRISSSKADIIFVTDVRFLNEAEFIKSYEGGEVIRVKKQGQELRDVKYQHASEKEIDLISEDYEISALGLADLDIACKSYTHEVIGL